MLHPGDTAPDFELLTDEGTPLKLSSLRGKTVVLYFYPRADTPGCTTESCSFRDAFPRFEGANAVILGISSDDVKDQAKFRQKYDLPFNLLADTEKTVHDQYGTWGEKTYAGRSYMGTLRTTYIIGPDGKIQHVFENVKPQGHGEQVLAALN